MEFSFITFSKSFFKMKIKKKKIEINFSTFFEKVDERKFHEF